MPNLALTPDQCETAPLPAAAAMFNSSRALDTARRPMYYRLDPPILFRRMGSEPPLTRAVAHLTNDANANRNGRPR